MCREANTFLHNYVPVTATGQRRAEQWPLDPSSLTTEAGEEVPLSPGVLGPIPGY